MQFDKIKWNGERMRIEYTVPQKDGNPDLVSITSEEPPSDDFLKAYDALAEHVPEWVDVPVEWSKSISLRGVNLYWKSDVFEAQLVCVKTLSRCPSPLNFNAPKRASRPIDALLGDLPESDRIKYLPPEATMAINGLIAEAKKYVEGSRAQRSLFEADQAKAA